jgi:hypothetical protein
LSCLTFGCSQIPTDVLKQLNLMDQDKTPLRIHQLQSTVDTSEESVTLLYEIAAEMSKTATPKIPHCSALEEDDEIDPSPPKSRRDY